MNKYVYILKIITLFCALSVTSVCAQGPDFGAFSRGAEEARRQNQADEDYANRRRRDDYERIKREQENERRRVNEENRINFITQYRKKFKETNDFRYVFMASEIGDAQATTFLISSGVFCGKNAGEITCFK